MKKNSHLFTDVVRTVAVAALLATITFASVQAVAAKASAEDRVEARITELRTQINITPAQEGQWREVTQVMRDNAKTLDRLVKLRLKNAKTMTAVEDIKSYGKIAAAHADGVQKLTPVFEALYDSMSEAQKKEADEAFRHGHRHRHAKNRNH
jgi:hypothetical protein